MHRWIVYCALVYVYCALVYVYCALVYVYCALVYVYCALVYVYCALVYVDAYIGCPCPSATADLKPKYSWKDRNLSYGREVQRQRCNNLQMYEYPGAFWKIAGI
jgi:hypothetical protein